MPETIEQFAKRIKAQYKEYADVDDYELTERVVRKYPTYISQVDLPSDFRLLKTTSGYKNLDDIYEKAGRENGVDPNLLLEQGRIETINFKPEVMYGRQDSPKGARGAGQFMPGTAPLYGLTVNANQDDRTDPIKSINAQARYMKKLLEQFGGREDLALAGYNAGENRQVLRDGNIPNIAETQNYVKLINTALTKARNAPTKALREYYTNQAQQVVQESQQNGVTNPQPVGNLAELEAQRAKLYAERSLAQGMFPQTYKKTTPQLDEIERNIERLKANPQQTSATPTEGNPFAGAGTTPQTQNGNVVNPQVQQNGNIVDNPTIANTNGRVVGQTQTLGGDETSVPKFDKYGRPVMAQGGLDNPPQPTLSSQPSAADTQVETAQTGDIPIPQGQNAPNLKDDSGNEYVLADQTGVKQGQTRYTRKVDGVDYPFIFDGKSFQSEKGIPYPKWLTDTATPKIESKIALGEKDADYQKFLNDNSIGDSEERRKKFLAGGLTEQDKAQLEEYKKASTNQQQANQQQTQTTRKRTQEIQQSVNQNRQTQTQTQGTTTQKRQIPKTLEATTTDEQGVVTPTKLVLDEIKTDDLAEGEHRYIDQETGENLIATVGADGQIKFVAEADKTVVEKIQIVLPKKVTGTPAELEQAKRRRAAEVADQIAIKYNLKREDVIDWLANEGFTDLEGNKLTNDRYFQTPKDKNVSDIVQNNANPQIGGEYDGATDFVQLTERDINRLQSFSASRTENQAEFDVAKKGYVAQGDSEYIADVKASRDTGRMSKENADKEIEAYNKFYNEDYDFFNKHLRAQGVTINGKPLTDEEIVRRATESATNRIKELRDSSSDGTLRAVVESRKRWDALSWQEQSWEIVKEIPRTIYDGIGNVARVAGTLAYANPVSFENSVRNLFNGVANVFGGGTDNASLKQPKDSVFYQFGDWEIDTSTKGINQNPDAKHSPIVKATNAITQVGVQLGLAYLTGGISAGGFFGIGTASGSEIEKARKAGATPRQQIIVGAVAGAAAIPDLILQKIWFRGLTGGQQTGVLRQAMRTLYQKWLPIVGAKDAALIAKTFGEGFKGRAKTLGYNLLFNTEKELGKMTVGRGVGIVAASGATEFFQEPSETVINRATAKWTYKPQMTWGDVVKIDNEIIDAAIYGGVGGLFGGGAQVTIETVQGRRAQNAIISEAFGNIIKSADGKSIVIAGKEFALTEKSEKLIAEYNKAGKEITENSKKLVNLVETAKKVKTDAEKTNIAAAVNEVRTNLTENIKQRDALENQILEATGATETVDQVVSAVTGKPKQEITLKPIVEKAESVTETATTETQEGGKVTETVKETDVPKIKLPQVGAITETAKEIAQTENKDEQIQVPVAYDIYNQMDAITNRQVLNREFLPNISEAEKQTFTQNVIERAKQNKQFAEDFPKLIEFARNYQKTNEQQTQSPAQVESQALVLDKVSQKVDSKENLPTETPTPSKTTQVENAPKPRRAQRTAPRQPVQGIKPKTENAQTVNTAQETSAQSFSEFLKEKGYDRWYKSNRPIARYEESGSKRISEKQYVEFEKEFEASQTPKKTAKETAAAQTVEKQPFEMTQAEYVQSHVGIEYEDFIGRKKTIRADNERDIQFSKDTHYHKVRFAIAEGKTVPAKVLADYPNLQNKTADEVRKDVVKQYPNLAKKYAKTAPKSEKPVLKMVSSIENVPYEVRDIYKKSLKFKNPKFYSKTADGGIYYHTNWEEIVGRIKIFSQQGRDSEWIKNKINKEYDVYGAKKPKSTEDLYDEEYNHPSEIPQDVYEKARNASLLFSDANDAVRFARILGTENDERYNEGEVTIYRAVEKRDFSDVRPGDWVTTEKEYAEQHNDRYFNGKGKIIEIEVDGSDVLVSPTGNNEEAIYAPKELSKPYESYQEKPVLKNVASVEDWDSAAYKARRDAIPLENENIFTSIDKISSLVGATKSAQLTKVKNNLNFERAKFINQHIEEIVQKLNKKQGQNELEVKC